MTAVHNLLCMRDRVIIESPFKGQIVRNVSYADALMLDSISRGEAPFLGHLLYPRVLNDDIQVDRDAGIECHLSWLTDGVKKIIIGMDLGEPTGGMQAAILLAEQHSIPLEQRYLGPDWAEKFTPRRTDYFY